MAKRNSDMLPNQVTALPCAATFPGLPGAGATVLPSATVTVSCDPSTWPAISQLQCTQVHEHGCLCYHVHSAGTQL